MISKCLLLAAQCKLLIKPAITRSKLDSQHRSTVLAMAVFSEGGVSSPDIYIGVSFLSLLLICTFLNSLVLLDNYHKKSSIARSLFLCLSATDLLAGWLVLAPYLINVLREKEEECRGSRDVSCNQEYFKRRRTASSLDKIQSAIFYTIILAPSNITSLLAITRYSKIKYPFRQIKLKWVLFALSGFVLWNLTFCMISSFSPQSDGMLMFVTPVINAVMIENPTLFGSSIGDTAQSLLMAFITVILQVLAILASILTIHELLKPNIVEVAESRRKESLRSCLRILVTNFGSAVTLLSLSITIYNLGSDIDRVTLQGWVGYFCTFVVIPSCFSALNPVIYISTMKRKLRVELCN